jgi:hypothetical protein
MRFWVPSLIAAWLALSQAACADAAELLQPDWSAAATSKYLSAKHANIATAAPLPDSAQGQQDAFSLPVLGLKPTFSQTTITPAMTDEFIGAAAPAPGWWPSCASSLEAPEIAKDDSGTWYSAVYNFGCITVSLYGDRNSSAPPTPEIGDILSEPLSDTPSTVDEVGSSAPLSVSWQFVRFSIPYVLTIDCNSDSAAFCGDPNAQRTLIDRLAIVAGAPK